MAGATENRRVYISINDKEVKNTYRGIRNEVSNLRRQLQNTTRGTEDFEHASRKLKVAEKHFKDVREEVGQTNRSIQKSGGLLNGLGPMIAGAFSIAAVQELSQAVIDVRSRFERYFAVLKTSLGSARAANKEFQMIKNFAADTPFSVDELTDSFVKLTNQGFKPNREELRKMGDLAASTGKQYDQLAEAIIDAQTGEFERLKEFGIRAKKEGDKVTFTFKEQKTQVDFTASAIQDYIVGLGDLQGVSGSMAEISKTLGGRISNLGDAWDTLLFNIGNVSIFKETIRVMTDLLSVVNNFMEVPMSDKLREEQAEMNALFGVLKSTNITEKQRLDLIGQINSNYGPYLDNLLTEKSSINEIRIAQEAANKAYSERILLAATKEEQQALIAEATQLQRGIFDLEKMQQDFRQKIIANPEGADAQMYSDEIDLLGERIEAYKEKIEATNEEFLQFNERNAEVLARLKLQEEEEDAENAPQVVGTRERYEKIITSTKEFHNVMGDLEKDFQADLVDTTVQSEKIKRQQIAITTDAQRAALNHLVSDLQAAASEFPVFTAMAKRAAQAQALVDTYAGAQSSYNALAGIPVVGPVLGAVAASAAVVAGLARVRKIENTQFAEGGITKGLGFKDNTGFQVAGVVHEDEQVIPKWMRQSPMYAPTLDALEFARSNNIGRFSSGGIPQKALPSSQHSPVSINSEGFDASVGRFSEKIDELVNKGIYAVADDEFERAMREKRERDDEIIDTTRI